MSDMVGFLINAGLSHYFHIYIMQYHHSSLFVKQYKGLLCYHTVMEHPQMWKYFYYDCVQENTLKESANKGLTEKSYEFAEWYHTTPRNDTAYPAIHQLESFSSTSKNCKRDPSSVSETLRKPYVCGVYGKEAKTEVLHIRRCVNELLLDLSTRMQRDSYQLSFQPILTGSMAENTQVGYPNDIDYLLHMNNHREILQDCSFLSTTGSPTVEIHKHSKPLNLGKSFSDFSKDMNKHLNHYNFPEGIVLIQNIQPEFYVKPLHFKLKWRGSHFKDLTINIDVAPALSLPFAEVEKLFPIIRDSVSKSKVYIIPKFVGHVDTDVRLSFSVCELAMIKAEPQYVRSGYRLAKALRNCEVCPALQKSNGQFVDAENCITSYMLKTCLLHAIDYSTENSSLRPSHDISSDDVLHPLSICWALEIYNTMKTFIENNRGLIIPNYFVITGDICSRYQTISRRGEYEEHLLENDTKIVMFFITTIIHLLENLDK